MPIRQQPTLNVVDLDSNQFEILFGIDMIAGENTQQVNIPNLGGGNFDVYNIDLTSVKSPARGNFNAIRCIQFALRTKQILGSPAPDPGCIYIVNIQTQQVIALLAPAPGAGFSSLVMGNVPFFAKATQQIAVYRDFDESVNCEALLSVSAFTFDCSSFLTTMSPFTGAGLDPLPVEITGTPAVSISGTPAVSISGTPSVTITGQPIDVTVVP